MKQYNHYDEEKGTRHIKKFNSLVTERSDLNGTYQLIAQYVMPGKGRFFTNYDNENAIIWGNRDLYDSTAVVACETLAASVHGNLTSPATDWFSFRFRDEALNQDEEASEWLYECKDACWYAIQESNFNQEVNEFYLDAVGFGTAVMVEEYDKEVGLKYKTYMCREAYFEDDFDDKPMSIYRQREYTATQLVERFGAKRCPDTIKEQAASPTAGNTKHSVVHCIYRREYEVGEEVDLNKSMPHAKRPYQELYILTADGSILSEPMGHYEMPGFVMRWKKAAGSKFGYSPAMVVMPDILSLNQLVEYILKSTVKAIDPPILARRRGYFGNISLESGAVNIVADEKAIRPFDGGANFQVGMMEKQELVNAVRAAFFIDKLELKESPSMTATEVNVRYELMMRLLGPTLSRMQADFLEPMLTRTFNLLYRNKKLPPMPDIVRESQGKFEIEYLGPMARAQKLSEVDAIQKFLGTVGPMSEFDPAVLDKVDLDVCVEIIANALGVPPKAIVDKDDVAEKREAQQQQQQQQQQMAMGQEMAGAAKDAASAELNMAKAQQLGM